MRISDWSSDVCSSDLGRGAANAASPARQRRNLDACEKNCGCRRGPGSGGGGCYRTWRRSEEHTSELQSLMRISYAVFCLKKKTTPRWLWPTDATSYILKTTI